MNTAVAETEVNPFGNAPIVAAPRSRLVAAAQRELADVQGSIMLAKMNPRDNIAAMDEIIQACMRPSLAEVATYEYSRGGTEITGPTIRLAECIAQCWDNIHIGWREDRQAGKSVVEVWAWDLQKNHKETAEFEVPHERHTGQGIKMLTDPRDIYETVANQAARRRRACILAVIPSDVVETAVKQCEKTLKVKTEVTKERLQEMLTAFAEFGVTREQIEKRIQRRLDAISPAQLIALGKIYNSLKDGMSQPAAWFKEQPAPAPEPEGEPETPKKEPATTRTAALKETLRARKPAPPPEPPPPAAEPLTGSEQFQYFTRRARNARSDEQLMDVADLMRNLPEEEVQAAQSEYDAACKRVREGKGGD